MTVWDEKDGERRKFPLGERERAVGVSLCPVRAYTCSHLRRSYTYKPSQKRQVREREEEETYVNLIINRTNIHIRTIRTPRNSRHRASHIKRRNGVLPRVLASLPYLHRAIVRARSHQLGPGTACHRPVHRIDNLAVRTDAAVSLAGGDVRHAEHVVCGDGVECR